MALLIAGLLLFLGVHSVGIAAPGLRAGAVAKLGEGPWKVLYSLISIAGFALLVRGFALARAAPVVLYSPPSWLRHVTFLLMLPVFTLLLAAYLPGRIKTVLKHPMLTAVKFWATAHLLSNGTLPDVVLFGGFLLWAVLERISLKRRGQRAMVTAPTRPYNDALAVVAGLALYGLFIGWAHVRLFGVSPLG